MRDYVELANSLDPNLPNMKQREIVCDALLEDLKNLKGKDLAPYLSECVFDVVEPGTKFVLKFPPCIPHKQQKKRENLQSSGEHIKDQNKLGRIGEQAEVGRRAY